MSVLPEALARRLEELEARVARLEESRLHLHDEPPPVPAAVVEAIDEVSTSGPLALAGRTLIALGGGYLLRMVTTAGGLEAATGVGLGLAYAAGWTFEADREARRGRALPASLAAGTGALLAYPLLWEASTRFGAVPVRAALFLAVALVFTAGAAGGRRDRPSFAWIHLAPALLLAFGLLFQAHDATAVLAALAALHGAAELAAARPGWRGLRWATGAAVAVMAVAVVSVPSPVATIAAVAALGAAVLVAALLRARRRPADAYDLAGGAAALALAVAAAAALPPALRFGPALAALALAVAASFGAARAATAPKSAQALTLAGTALAIAATMVVLGPAARVTAWSAAGLAAAWLSPRARRHRAAAFVFLAAALAASGALAAGLGGVTGVGGWSPLPVTGLLAAAAALAPALMGARADGGRRWRLAGALAGGLGLAAIATAAWPAAGLAAVAGTGTLAAMAAAATVSARGRAASALRPLAWTLLVLGGMRLLLVDLRDGRPLTLFIGLVTYGAALLVAQASRRRPPARGEA
jgi:hypothetical protein